jgi:hypothetical protein
LTILRTCHFDRTYLQKYNCYYLLLLNNDWAWNKGLKNAFRYTKAKTLFSTLVSPFCAQLLAQSYACVCLLINWIIFLVCYVQHIAICCYLSCILSEQSYLICIFDLFIFVHNNENFKLFMSVKELFPLHHSATIWIALKNFLRFVLFCFFLFCKSDLFMISVRQIRYLWFLLLFMNEIFCCQVFLILLFMNEIFCCQVFLILLLFMNEIFCCQVFLIYFIFVVRCFKTPPAPCNRCCPTYDRSLWGCTNMRLTVRIMPISLFFWKW